MNLDPDSFSCPRHGIDLTDQVRAVLGSPSRPPVAMPGLRRAGQRRPFAVPVTCPGSTPEDEHPQICEGRYWP